jgi:hypothetical protein
MAPPLPTIGSSVAHLVAWRLGVLATDRRVDASRQGPERGSRPSDRTSCAHRPCLLGACIDNAHSVSSVPLQGPTAATCDRAALHDLAVVSVRRARSLDQDASPRTTADQEVGTLDGGGRRDRPSFLCRAGLSVEWGCGDPPGVVGSDVITRQVLGRSEASAFEVELASAPRRRRAASVNAVASRPSVDYTPRRARRAEGAS